MARRDTAKPGNHSKRLPIAKQEDVILAVYADMVERGDLDDMFGLMRHAGIALLSGDMISGSQPCRIGCSARMRHLCDKNGLPKEGVSNARFIASWKIALPTVA